MEDKELLKALNTLEESLKSEIQSLKPSESNSESEAQLKEKDDKITELEEQVAELQEKADNYDKLESLIKTPDGFVEFAAHFGYDKLIPTVPDAEVEEDEEDSEEVETEEKTETETEEPEDKQVFISGRTDKPDFKYFPHLDISVKKE